MTVAIRAATALCLLAPMAEFCQSRGPFREVGHALTDKPLSRDAYSSTIDDKNRLRGPAS